MDKVPGMYPRKHETLPLYQNQHLYLTGWCSPQDHKVMNEWFDKPSLDSEQMPPIRHNSGLMSGVPVETQQVTWSAECKAADCLDLAFRNQNWGLFKHRRSCLFGSWRLLWTKIVDLGFIKVILCMTKLEKGTSWQIERGSKKHQSSHRIKRLILYNVLGVLTGF
jgi:hypothetical protein